MSTPNGRSSTWSSTTTPCSTRPPGPPAWAAGCPSAAKRPAAWPATPDCAASSCEATARSSTWAAKPASGTGRSAAPSNTATAACAPSPPADAASPKSTTASPGNTQATPTSTPASPCAGATTTSCMKAAGPSPTTQPPPQPPSPAPPANKSTPPRQGAYQSPPEELQRFSHLLSYSTRLELSGAARSDVCGKLVERHRPSGGTGGITRDAGVSHHHLC